MAVPASFTPASTPTASRPPVTPGTVQPTPQLFESPTFAPQRPATPPIATKPATSPIGAKPNPPAKSNKKFIIAGIVLILLVIGGLGASLLLVREPQDVRQQASTPTGTSRILLAPATGSFPAGSAQKLQVKVNIGGTTKIDGVQFVATLSNTIPQNIAFKPANIEGLRLIINSLSDAEDGKKLTVAFVTTPPTPFTGSANDLVLGELEFTAPGEGDFNITFDPTLSKIIQNQTTDDILKTPPSYTYSFTGGGGSSTPTPTPTATPGTGGGTPTPTPSGGIGGNPSPTPTPVWSPGITPSPTATPTSTPVWSPGITPSPTATPTPTASGGTGGTTYTPTPTPSGDGRTVTQPTSSQDQPVSGSTEMTLFLLLLGGGLISLGVFMNQKLITDES